MQCLLWEASIAQAHGEAGNTLYKLLAVTQWLVCITSQTTIYRIFCMSPTRKSLAASESLTQTRKCC